MTKGLTSLQIHNLISAFVTDSLGSIIAQLATCKVTVIQLFSVAEETESY